MSFSFRLAEPKDAEAFANWVVANPQVSVKEIESGKKTNNPTVITFVVENDKGEVVMFSPVYAQLTFAYLGFNPESMAADRKQALQMLVDGTAGFAVQYGFREITALSQENFPVAKWAMTHGFDLEPMQLLKYDINKVLAEAEKVQA